MFPKFFAQAISPPGKEGSYAGGTLARLERAPDVGFIF